MRARVFFLAFALLAVVAQSSRRHHHHAHVQTNKVGGGGELARARSWPCCSGCTKSVPVPGRSAAGACRDCVRSSLSVDPPFCQRRCTAP